MITQPHEFPSPPRSTSLRVLHLVSTFEVKTDTKWLHQLIGRLDREKFAPAIACFYRGGEMMQRFADLGIPVFNLNAPGRVSPAAGWRVYRLIRDLAPQIVHVHLLRANLYGALAARLAGVPVILTTLYALGGYRRDKIRRLDNLLDLLCRKLATDALAVSAAVGDDWINRGHWPAERITTIHTGLEFADAPADSDQRERLRRQWQIPESAPLVLTVARLSYEKGINVLIQAAEQVHRECRAARFVIVGDGPLREQLLTQVRAAALSEVVRLAGFRRDVAAVLSAGDLFVMPSLMEGLPNALLEAYAAGLPVIATSAGGLAEAVEHEQSGLLVQPNSPRELAAAIIRLLTDEPLRRRLAGDGRRWAEQRFSVQRVARQYESLYERLYQLRTGSARTVTVGGGQSDPVTET